MDIVDSGAEAVIYKDGGLIVKDRVSKGYRHPEIDLHLRKFRTKREAKVLAKLAELNFPAPRLVKLNAKDMRIEMDFIDGRKLKDVLAGNPEAYAFEIGKRIAAMHNADIIHSDLTTSNMIVKDEGVYFIDFGLSFFSKKIEDKAVDLHLLERALESKHHEISRTCFTAVIKGYREVAPDAKEVLKRLERVEKRGRNKIKD